MKRLESDEAVSEVLGYILILGIVLTALAITLILIFPSIQDSKDTGQLKEVAQGLTVVDSRLSKARFSTSIFQEAPFNLDDGTVIIDESTSHIKVTEKDDPPLSPPVAPVTLYEGSLGTIKVVTNNGEIAYEDGGVFLKYPNGDTIMQSPPDFDYNGVTLTLPIMKIVRNTGDFSNVYTSANKYNTVMIESQPSDAGIIVEYPNDNNPIYTNPLEQAKIITVTITSDYYKGWYSYFKELGLNPTKDDITKSVSVDLSSGHGRQQLPIANGNGFDTKYMEPDGPNDKEPILAFNFLIVVSNTGADQKTYYSTNKHVYPNLEIDISGQTQQNNKEYVKVLFKYQYASGNNNQEIFEGWVPFQRKSDTEFTVDLLSVSTQDPGTVDGLPLGVMKYTANDDSISWGNNNAAYDVIASDADASDVDVSNVATTYKSMYDVTQHYMLLMHQLYPDGPEYEYLSQSGDTIPPSQFILEFKSRQQIKFLYITKAELNTGISSKSS